MAPREMMAAKLSIVFVTFLAAWFGTMAVRKYALWRGMLDIPNGRSSHSIPTPRGGGVAIVGSFLISLAVWNLVWGVAPQLFWALIPSGLLVAGIGLVDDHAPLPALFRLTVHIAASVWAVYATGGVPSLDLGFAQVSLGLGGSVLAVIGLVWCINLYNFMDGIDGIAGGQGVFIGLTGSVLLGLQGGDAWPFFLLAAASGGFLMLNWPPARIFMGDAGSGFLGFAIGIMALHEVKEARVSVWTWGILMGVFVVDTTVTLLRRAIRGISVTSPHRTHAYQRVARHCGSHRTVTLGVLAIGAVGLIPLALISIFLPKWAMLTGTLTAVLLTIAAVILRAGDPEEAPATDVSVCENKTPNRPN